jgi:hypothetical protein
MFPGLEERPRKLVWEVIERSDPVKLFTFRMADIPLPAPLEFNAKAVAPNPGVQAPPDRLFYAKGGGILVSRILVAGKPAGNGILDVGMAEKRGPEWGPLRWTQVEVLDGIARLDDLKAGVYRVVRRFRAKEGVLPEGGKWTNEDLQVALSDGKEATPSPLHWAVVPSKPAPPRTPPGKRSSN